MTDTTTAAASVAHLRVGHTLTADDVATLEAIAEELSLYRTMPGVNRRAFERHRDAVAVELREASWAKLATNEERTATLRQLHDGEVCQYLKVLARTDENALIAWLRAAPEDVRDRAVRHHPNSRQLAFRIAPDDQVPRYVEITRGPAPGDKATSPQKVDRATFERLLAVLGIHGGYRETGSTHDEACRYAGFSLGEFASLTESLDAFNLRLSVDPQLWPLVQGGQLAIRELSIDERRARAWALAQGFQPPVVGVANRKPAPQQVEHAQPRAHAIQTTALLGPIAAR